MPGTEVMQIEPEGDYAAALRHAGDVLRGGGLVAFPTETVYGVGARADVPEALDRLRAVKGRRDDKPFTVHVARREEVHRFVPELSATGRRLVAKAWPGPLTVIFPVADPSAARVLADSPAGLQPALYHQGTIGLRCPDHAAARDLLSSVDAPVVAASGNLPGRPAARDAQGVLAELEGLIDVVLDAGAARYGKASTIVRLNGQGYEILREGVYDARALRRLSELCLLLVCTGNTCRSPMAAGLLRRLLAERLGCDPDGLADHGIRIDSAGTAAAGGAPASPQAIDVLRDLGVDIAGHRSQRLTPELIHRADHILTMTGSHREAVLRLVPQAAERCRVISGQHDIEDPIGQPTAAYAACAREIESALRDSLAEMLL